MEENSLTYKPLEPIEILDIFPYKVYRDYGSPLPDSEGRLKLLEAGFLEMEDAKLYINAKTEKTGMKYVLECMECQNK